jgi:hypothetical protein
LGKKYLPPTNALAYSSEVKLTYKRGFIRQGLATMHEKAEKGFEFDLLFFKTSRRLHLFH